MASLDGMLHVVHERVTPAISCWYLFIHSGEERQYNITTRLKLTPTCKDLKFDVFTVWSPLLHYFLMRFAIFVLFQTERDVSVRQRAVDLLYAMCDKNNAEEIVSEMLTYLETADYSIKEEMVILHFIIGCTL